MSRGDFYSFVIEIPEVGGVKCPKIQGDGDFARAVGGVNNVRGAGKAGEVFAKAGHDGDFFF